jgi:hypothetical protein
VHKNLKYLDSLLGISDISNSVFAILNNKTKGYNKDMETVKHTRLYYRKNDFPNKHTHTYKHTQNT